MNSLHALVVEDEIDLAEIFDTIFVRLGVSTDIALDGLKALDILNTTVPDIILLDINLPHVTGDEILTHIRATEHLKHCKVIIASANADTIKSLHGLADFVLVKPVTMTELLNLLRQVISTLETT